MKNISKRLLSLAMVIAMVLSMMPTTVFAIEEFPVYVDGQGYASLEAAVEAANSGSVIKLMDDVTLSETVTLPAGVTLDGNGKTINGSVKAGGDLTFAGKTTIATLSLGWYNNTITIGKDASLEVTTGRVTVSYGNVFNVIGNITDAKTADKATVTPSLKLNAGISMNGNGGGVKFNITDAYVILGDSSSKNSGATGEFNINIDNSIVDFTKTLKTYQPTVAGLDPSFNINAKDSVVGFASHLELWNAKTNLTLDNTNLTVGSSFANAGTVEVTNGSYFLVKAPIMSSHGGNTGTIVADGGVFELADSNEDWQNAGTMKVAGNGKLVTNDFKCVGEGQVVVDVANIPEGAVVIEANDDNDFVAGIVIENGTADVTLESGKIVVENVVSKTYVAEVNGEKFETLEAAFAAAAEGDTIKLLADAAPVLTSQRKITSAAVIDLNGFTLSLAEDDLYFGTTTFKNGNIVVDPSVYANTAVFWMFAGQTLNFENVKLTGTGVSGTYLIGLEGGATLNLKDTEILVNNASSVKLSAVIADNGNGSTVIDNSKITVNNLNGRGFLYGNYTVKNGSEIEISGVKAGFYIGAGQNLNIEDTSSVSVSNLLSGYTDGIFLAKETATYTKADTATVNSTVTKFATLEGSGTAEDPYMINSVEDLILFRDSVNAGETKYSAPGVYVALGADIDLAGINWVGIGSATAAHGFMGNFDGNGFVIKNLNIENPTLDSDGYAYAGLFSITEGVDKDHQNIIKNLVIENVTISTTGHIVAAAIAYPYYTIVENVTVRGNIAITGGNYTAGVLAYTRRCVNASNLSVIGNAGSYITGAQTVGGVISDIQTNGGLVVDYANFSVENVAITGTKQVGGIAGIIATQTINGVSVKNVTLAGDSRVGIIAGAFGGTSAINGATYENVTGATAIIGGAYNTNATVEAKIGNTYYATLVDAIAAAQDGDTVTLLADIELTEGVVVPAGKTITLDLNGKTITATGSYVFSLNPGTLTVKDSSAEKTGMIDGTETVGNVFLVYGGALTIESGKIHANNNVIFTYQSSSVITINGGELKSVIATGNILYLYEANTTTTVNGGTFYGPVACYAGTLKVAGGTFATDVSAYCAYGKTTKLVDGMYHIVDAEKKNIYIGENSYLTLEDALNAAKDGDVIEIRAAGSYQLKRGALQEGAYYLPKNLTIKGTVDGVVVTNGPTIRCESIKLDNIDFINPSTSNYSSGLVFQISGDSQITNCTMDGYWGGSYYSLVNGSLLIDNCVIKGAVYGLNISENYDSDITITNTEISGWTSFAGDYNVVLDGCNLTHNGSYGYLGFHGDARIKNCTFGEGMEIGYMAEGITLYIDNSTAANGASVEGILEDGVGEKYDVYLDGVLLGDVELPEIQITDIKGSLKDTDPDLTFALNFAIKNPESLTEAYLEKLFAIYGGYYVDYVLTISGLNGGTVTFNANSDSDGYLAGQYDAWSENWLSVPFDDVVVKDGEGLYIMEYAAKLMNKQGLRFTLAEVAEIVQNFDCGVYFTPEFLAEHPDLKVSLQLKVFTEDAQGNKIENIDVATNNFENNYAAVVCGENKQSAYYATFAEAYAAAQAGDTIELLADATLTSKLTINKAVTIDGNGHSLIADETATWSTGSGFKKTYTHIVGVNSNNVTLKNVVIDCNSLSNGVNIYQVDGIVLDNVSIINSKYGYYALTVNDSSVTAKTALTIKTTTGAIDISKGDSSMVMEAGTVTDLSNKTVFFDTTGAVDLSGAVKADGTVYFVAKDNAYYYTEKQIESRPTAFSNGLTLLSDVELADKAMEVKSTLNLNGYDLTVKTLKVSGSLAVIGDGNINGEVLLTNTTATVTTDKTLTAASGVEGYVVDYADGAYKLVVAANDVAENVQTGVTYTDLQEALSAAAKGETVKLLKDVEAEDIYISAGKTLDLNGYKLTITSTISASYSTTHIIDSTAAKGLLILAEGVESALNSQNAQLPVWTAEGVHFIDVTFGRALDFKDQTGAANADVAYFRFAFDENQVLLDQILANGSDGTGLTIRIKVNYTTASGMKAYQYFEYTNELVASYYQYASGWQNAAFKLYLNGVESLADLSFTAEIVSVGPNGTSVIKSSVPL